VRALQTLITLSFPCLSAGWGDALFAAFASFGALAFQFLCMVLLAVAGDGSVGSTS
jgi:hypothetical protein